jgi:hypothetical protein
MQERKTVLRGYSREAQKTKTEKEKHMHSAKIITALIAITFLVGPAAVLLRIRKVVPSPNIRTGMRLKHKIRFRTGIRRMIHRVMGLV